MAPTVYTTARCAARSNNASPQLQKAEAGRTEGSTTRFNRKPHQGERESIDPEGSCPECGSTATGLDGCIAYCADCGVVLSEQRLERSEPPWREPEDRRLGPADSTLWLNTGTVITGAQSGGPGRLRKYNDRLSNSERSIVRGLRELRSLAARLELPAPVRERAAYLYRQSVTEDLLRGRSIEGLAAGCLFIAARERHHPTTIDFLATVSPVAAGSIRQYVGVLKSGLGVAIPPAHPRDFLPLLISRLPLESSVERLAGQYLEQVTDEGLHVGKHPAAVAATAVYAAAIDTGIDITQQAVAEAADVSAVTISRHYQAMQDAMTAASATV